MKPNSQPASPLPAPSDVAADAPPGPTPPPLKFATSHPGEPIHEFMSDVFRVINVLARTHAVDANMVVNALAAGLGQMVAGELTAEDRARVCAVIAEIIQRNADLEAARRLLSATAGSA